MMPAEFLAQYHALSIADFGQGIVCTADLRKYVSGMPSLHRVEYEHTLGAIASKCLKLGRASSVPTWFTIPGRFEVPPTEEFSRPGIRRAYGGRASPNEIRDTVRLACLVGRCKPWEAKTYAEKWFGLDCNAFVGNYQGISPSSSIDSYIGGYGSKETIKGATADIYLSRDLLPLPPVRSADDIRAGTVIVTYGEVNSWGSHWRHIALVESFALHGDSKATISIVEWGRSGGTPAHTDFDRTIELRCEDFSGKLKRYGGRKIYAFWNDYAKTQLRIFLDASSWSHIASRGWHIGERWES